MTKLMVSTTTSLHQSRSITASNTIFMRMTPKFTRPTQLLPWTLVPISSCLDDVSRMSQRHLTWRKLSSHPPPPKCVPRPLLPLSKWLLILLIAQARNLLLTLMSNPAAIPTGLLSRRPSTSITSLLPS